MPVLVLNAGSSSLKWELFATPELASLKSGAVGRIGEPGSPVPDHAAALRTVFAELGDVRPDAVGHRVVHGGEFFTGPVRVDADVTARIASLVPLAPLHNPPALAGIAAAGELLPGVPQAAVFDTAFHQTLEPAAYRYALPEWCYTEHRVRRYGMHGTSHQFVSRAAAEFLNSNPADLNLVSLHLGNGASVAAVAGGRCVDTSMGLTPLEGLVMGTRSGDLDPAVVPYLCRQTGMPVAAVERLLNRDSGLKGLCGANDMREVTAAAAGGDGHAELALTMFCRRAAKYVGAYAVVLGPAGRGGIHRGDRGELAGGPGDASATGWGCWGWRSTARRTRPARPKSAASARRMRRCRYWSCRPTRNAKSPGRRSTPWAGS